MRHIVSWRLKNKSVAFLAALLLIGQLISSSLSLTVIGGLATSNFLTLLVVPAGYSLLEGLRGRREKRYAR